MAGATVRVNFRGMDAKISKSAFTRGRRAMANQMGADMNQFVPRKSGHLRASQTIATDGSFVQWNAVYAHRHFNAPGGWKYTTGGTGPHWDEPAESRFKDSWTNAFVRGAGIH